MTTKRIMLTLIGGLLAFIAGIITAGSWNTPTCTMWLRPATATVAQQRPANPPPEPAITPRPSDSEVIFAEGRLRIVPEDVQLKSERLQYEIDVRYPQISGSNDRYLKKLNQRLRRLAVARYQSILHPTKEHLQRNKKLFPEILNTVDLDYEIVLATDSILSIYFGSYEYTIGAAHAAQTSYVVNYDLKSHRELKLADLFKPNSKYLEIIALYCTHELSPTESLFGPLDPNPETFASWNLTNDGIRFNFDACKITGCSSPPQEVTIPFTALTPFLKPGQVV